MFKPPQLTAENMTKIFMNIASDRYPSSAKILQQLAALGVGNSPQAKIAVLTQFRDAVKSVSLTKIYTSVQHRDEVYNAILEAMEEVEDQIEDMMEETDE
jgi:type III secretion protein W